MKCQNLKKSYQGRTLFEDVTFSMNQGIVLLTGRSGSGKSTFLRILMGKEKPDSGSFSFEEKSYSYCGQENLIPASESLSSFMKKLKLKKEGRYESLISLFDFSKLQTKKLMTLSGGERQKAELILALVKETDFYIFDEPFSSLDKQSKKIAKEQILSLAKTKLVFLVNHDKGVLLSPVICQIDFDEKGKVLLCDSSLEKKERRESKRKKIFSFPVFFSFLFKENRSYFILSLLFFLLSMFSFSSYSCLLCDNDRNKDYLIALKEDPFDYHEVNFTSSSFDDLKRLSSIEVTSCFRMKAGEKEFYLLDSLKEDRFESLVEDPFFFKKRVMIQGKEYEIQGSDDLFSCERTFSSAKHFSSDSFLFTSKNLTEKILTETDAFLEGERIQLGFSLFYQNHEFYEGSPSSSFSVVKKKEYLSLAEEKEEVSLSLDRKNFFLLSNSPNEEGKTIIGLDLLKSILLSSSLPIELRRNHFFLNKESLYSLLKKNKNLVIEDLTVNPCHNNPYNIVFLIFGIFFLFLLFLVPVFLHRDLREKKRKLIEIYQNNQIRENYQRDILLYSFVFPLILFLLCCFLYPVCLSFWNFLFAFLNRNENGSGFYSRMPKNDFYDGIFKPLPFLEGNLLFLLSALSFLVFFVISFFNLRKND